MVFSDTLPYEAPDNSIKLNMTSMFSTLTSTMHHLNSEIHKNLTSTIEDSTPTIRNTDSTIENMIFSLTSFEPTQSIATNNATLSTIMDTFSTISLGADTTTFSEDTTNAIFDADYLGSISHHHFPKAMLGFTAACAFIIAILGTVGNLLTIVALPMCKKLRTTSTAFVVNLAVVELMFCVIILPMAGTQYIFLQYNGVSLLTDEDCVYFTLGRFTFTQVQLQTIVAIAFTRAIAVGLPRFYQRINNNYVVWVWISFIWVYSLAIKIPTAMGIFGSYSFNKKSMECDMADIKENAFPKLIALVVEVLIPLLIIIFLYIYIFVKVVMRSCERHRKFRRPSSKRPVKSSSARVRRSSLRNNSLVSSELPTDDSTSATQNPETNSSGSGFRSFKRMMSVTTFSARLSRRSSSISHCINNNRRDMRVARTIFIIFIIMVICSFPVAYVHSNNSATDHPTSFLAAHILYWVQYCVNVIVYVLLNRQYRDAYIDLLVKLMPALKKHKGITFPWEHPSTGNSKIGSFKKPALSHDPNVGNDDTKRHSPANGCLGLYEARLEIIPEVNSSSIVSTYDEVVVPEKVDAVTSGSSGRQSPTQLKSFSEKGTDEEKQLWINKNGQHVSDPESDTEVKL